MPLPLDAAAMSDDSGGAGWIEVDAEASVAG
jgi:hypothetical protein